MTLGQVMRSIPARPGRKRLTFEEVLAARRPAVFEDFGDSLLFLDGEVFILRDIEHKGDIGATPPVLDPRLLVHAVGIETGWRHAEGCDCQLCSTHAA